MRTTLIMPEQVFRRAKMAAHREGRTLSSLVTDAICNELLKRESCRRKQAEPYRIKPVSMGREKVDLGNREQVYRVMEESE